MKVFVEQKMKMGQVIRVPFTNVDSIHRLDNGNLLLQLKHSKWPIELSQASILGVYEEKNVCPTCQK